MAKRFTTSHPRRLGNTNSAKDGFLFIYPHSLSMSISNHDDREGRYDRSVMRPHPPLRWWSALAALLVVASHAVFHCLAQDVVPLVPSQEQEIVDAHNAGREQVMPLPCSPLPTVAWDAILAEAAAVHALQCRQVLQEQSARRRDVQQAAVDFGIPATSAAIGQSISVLVTSVGGALGLSESISTNFQLGASSYNHTLNLCVSTDGVISPSTTLQCRQYVDMVTASVTSVGCALTQCPSVEFGVGAAPFVPPGGTDVFVFNCLYAPITGDFQTSEGLLTGPPYATNCPVVSTVVGSQTSPTDSPELPEPTTTMARTDPVTDPGPGVAASTQASANTDAAGTLSRLAEDTFRRVFLSNDDNQESNNGEDSSDSSDVDDDCMRRRKRRLRRLRSSSSSSDSGSASADDSDDDCEMSDSDSSSSSS
ncbi:uncharacterized protein LOC135825840 isoform X1 [Sycon ciliatum]|uniref:uncharacterized protein LOC135825840 isoform X1 n=2 Tax=Sycon ciliatum TaxID=27933 RepID=UPI0031F66059